MNKTAIPRKNTLYVAPDSSATPLEDAKAAATSGTTIVVLPGNYTAKNLLKNGVNWYFMPGAVVSRTVWDSPGAIFDDSSFGANGPVACKIDGFGEFVCNEPLISSTGISVPGEGPFSQVLWIQNPASAITFNCRKVTGTSDALDANFLVWVQDCASVKMDCDEISVNSAGLYGCAGWGRGNFWLNCREISAKRPYTGTDPNNVGGTYALWAQEPASSGATDWYITSDLIKHDTYSTIIVEGLTSGYKVWINAKEIRGASDGGQLGGSTVNVGTIELFGSGKLYVTAQKILSIGAPAGTYRNGPSFWQTGGELWVDVMKMTAESKINQTGSIPLYIKQTAGTSFYSVSHFEHVGNFSGDGVAMSGGTMEIQGGNMTILNGKGLVHSGGTSRVVGLKVNTSNTNNSANNPVSISAANMILDGCTLITPALAECVGAASAQTLKVLGTTFTNDTTIPPVNVTVSIGSITGNAAVA